MKFAREIATLKMLEEQSHLFLAHHIESSIHPEMTLDPNPQQYVDYETAGILRWYSMRADDGTLAGYLTFYVTQYLHHVKHKQAHQGLLFIQKQHRGPYFKDFIEFAKQELKSEGVEVIYLSANPNNTLHEVFEHWGFRLIGRTYEWDLKLEPESV